MQTQKLKFTAIDKKAETMTMSTVHAKADERVLRLRGLSDRLGICLSVLCVIHCFLTPIVLIFLPSLQLLDLHASFHEVLLVVIPLLAVGAFIPGYRRHRNWQVFAWALPGLALITMAATVFEGQLWFETGLSITGGLLLIQAHLLNRRLCACCECGHEH